MARVCTKSTDSVLMMSAHRAGGGTSLRPRSHVARALADRLPEILKIQGPSILNYIKPLERLTFENWCLPP
jgi:hypothetical protein